MNVIRHYDLLIDENNDPFNDPEPLRTYMDKWDGQKFINQMNLSNGSSVLEIGVGTGRLAARVAALCMDFVGIDISPKTVKRAKENLSMIKNVDLICGDFLDYPFERKFDVIYSSLTWLHIKEKQKAMNKVAMLLNKNGRFVLSVEKNQTPFVEYGTRRIETYPDQPKAVQEAAENTGLFIECVTETEFAYIFTVLKK